MDDKKLQRLSCYAAILSLIYLILFGSHGLLDLFW